MAHALYGYDGPCRNIHGHSYQLSVTVIGKPIIEKKNPKSGMVLDFSDLKKIVEKHIIQLFDHSLVLNENTPHKTIAKKNSLFGKIVLANYQPTCENLLIDFTDRIRKELPKDIRLHHLKLRETPGSFAEWYAEDNE
jgi:6-pyruvoyltetrahydropterin/6-carboxytetrahydropterin synthase